MKRRQEPATGYVAPDHTARTLAIAAGVGAASIGVAWKFKDRFIKMGENKVIAAQAAKRAERTSLQHAAKSAMGEHFRAAESEMVKHSDLLKSVEPKFQPGQIEYEHLTKARNYQTQALMRHNEQIKFVPQKKDWVYYSAPFDSDNPPRPGRMVPPDMAQKLKDRWTGQRAKKLYESKIKRQQDDQLRGTLSKTSLGRILLNGRERLVEFDISLKEGRGANGKFTSGGGMPPTSPRDLQNAYHAPIIRKHKQQEEDGQPKKVSTAKKVAIAGIGAAIGIASLGIASPELRRKVFGQAVKETEAAGAATAETIGTKLTKGSREAIEYAHTSEISALRESHDNAMKALRAQHEVNIANRVGPLAAAKENLKLQAATQGAARVAEENQRVAAEAKNVGLRAANETYRKVAEDTLTTPILGPTGAPANTAARHQQARLVSSLGEDITFKSGASDKLRSRLAGDPKGKTLYAKRGHIGNVQARIAKHEDELNTAIKMKASSYQINSIKGRIAAQKALLSDHTETLRRIDAGEISHPEMMGKLFDPSAHKAQQDAAHSALTTKVQEDARKATQSFKAHQEGLRKQERETAEKLKQDKIDTQSAPGWTGHDFHGKAPKSKNKRSFSDKRLTVRLCRAISHSMHELSV